MIASPSLSRGVTSLWEMGAKIGSNWSRLIIGGLSHNCKGIKTPRRGGGGGGGGVDQSSPGHPCDEVQECFTHPPVRVSAPPRRREHVLHILMAVEGIRTNEITRGAIASTCPSHQVAVRPGRGGEARRLELIWVT